MTSSRKKLEFMVGSTPMKKEAIVGSAHKGADRYSRQLALWKPPARAVDADVLPDKKLADARTHDISRNDSYAASGVSVVQDSIVGDRYMLSAKPDVQYLGLDDKDQTWETEFAAEVESKFGLYAESKRNWVDASEAGGLTDMVRLAVGVGMYSGEVFSVARWLRDTARPFRTAVQMIELNRLSDPMDRSYDRDRVRGGVEFNSNGAPIAYFVRRGEIGRFTFKTDELKWFRIRARTSFGRQQVIHIKDRRRPSQTRGISQIVSCLEEMKMGSRFRDISLQNAVVNASFAAAIESERPPETVFAQIGAGQAGAFSEYAEEFLNSISEYADNSRNLEIDGVRIPHLFPGTKLNLLPMGQPGGVGSEFEASLLRYIAAAYEISYEELSRDYRKTNYSSARAGMLQTWKSTRRKKKMFADSQANAVYGLWFEEAVNAGEIETMKYSKAPNMYDAMNMDAYTRAEWIGAAFGQVDEVKETQAALLRIRGGLSTYEKEIGKQGDDYRTVFRQQSREKALREELGIEEEQIDALNAASGDPRPPEGEEDE